MMSDLRTLTEQNTILIYADYTTLVVPKHTDIDIGDEFDHMKTWAVANMSIMNLNKTKEIVFRNLRALHFHMPRFHCLLIMLNSWTVLNFLVLYYRGILRWTSHRTSPRHANKLNMSSSFNSPNWKSAQVVNSHLVCDPTIRQPGFDLPRQQWSLLNRFRKEQGHCGACGRIWRLTDTDLCPCGETQMMSHIVESCPLTKLNGSLSRLHSADEDAVSWLTSYG